MAKFAATFFTQQNPTFQNPTLWHFLQYYICFFLIAEYLSTLSNYVSLKWICHSCLIHSFRDANILPCDEKTLLSTASEKRILLKTGWTISYRFAEFFTVVYLKEFAINKTCRNPFWLYLSVSKEEKLETFLTFVTNLNGTCYISSF